jgi:diaminopimelate decarboxylase
MEYEMAHRLGIPSPRIIYNGPYKPAQSLQMALSEGARVQIDHYDELYQAEKIAKDLGRKIGVSIRINMDAGVYPRWDRFGFNMDNGEALDAARRIHAGGALRLDGLHCHIGTFITEPSAYGKVASNMASLAKRLREENGTRIEYLDLGGGFTSRATLHSQYGHGQDNAPAMDDYAEAITGALLESNFHQNDLPTLILETGRALVDEAGFMLTRVVGNKRLPNGTRSIIIDAGVNVLFTSFWYRHDVLPTVDRGGMLENTVVYGPLCMNIDVIRPSVLLPPLETGDALVIRPVGAYNVSQWMQFIRYRPPVIMIGQNAEIDVIRKAESIEDMKNLEVLPKRLAV